MRSRLSLGKPARAWGVEASGGSIYAKMKPQSLQAFEGALIFRGFPCKPLDRFAGMGRDMSRIDDTFARLKSQQKKAFVAYIMAGDPDVARSLAVMKGLPGAGVDVIELGLPFTDPMADGPTIQLAGQRALEGGMTLDNTLQMVRDFRSSDKTTPIVLMGYYNPIYSRGVDLFLTQATEAGIDGLIIVDLPPEEDSELCLPAQAAGLNFIRLATPTTDAKRLPKVLQNTSGFRLLRLGHRHHRGGCGASGRCRAGSGADQTLHRSAGDRGLWHQHARRCTSHCGRGRWLRGGIGHRQGNQHRQTRGGGAGFCRQTRRRSTCGVIL